MGIRVHKLLGYGLTDVETDDSGYNIVDDRINTDSPGLNFNAPPDSEYREWLEAGREEGDIETDLDLFFLREWEPGAPRIDLDDIVTWDGEFGLPHVLVISPPAYMSFRRWARFDNIFDYIEETYLRKDIREPQVNRIDVLRHDIYSFIGYMDKRTGEKVNDVIFNWIRATNSTEPLDDIEMDTLAKACGFKSNADAWENVAPIVPNEVKNLATFLDLFTADDVWMQLRPMIYTYWS